MFALVGGSFADKFDRRRILIITQTLALFLMRFTPPVVAQSEQGKKVTFHSNVKEALSFAFTHGDIKRVLLLGIALSAFGLQYNALLPIYAAQILHGNVTTLGWLRAFAGMGALTADLRLAARSPKDLSVTLGVATAGFSVSLFAFSCPSSLPLSLSLVFCLGFCLTSLMCLQPRVLGFLIEA